MPNVCLIGFGAEEETFELCALDCHKSSECPGQIGGFAVACHPMGEFCYLPCEPDVADACPSQPSQEIVKEGGVCGAVGSHTVEHYGECQCQDGYEWCTSVPDDYTCCAPY